MASPTQKKKKWRNDDPHLISKRKYFKECLGKVGWVFFFLLNGISNFVSYSMPTSSLSKNSCNTLHINIMSCRQHGYPWPSLATPPYRSSPLAGLQGYIPYPHIAAVCMFELVVLLLLSHIWGSIGVHHLWARPCFSSSVLHVWFV